jgi:hypothetical protein
VTAMGDDDRDEEMRGSRFEFDGQEACFVKLRMDALPTTRHHPPSRSTENRQERGK